MSKGRGVYRDRSSICETRVTLSALRGAAHPRPPPRHGGEAEAAEGRRGPWPPRRRARSAGNATGTKAGGGGSQGGLAPAGRLSSWLSPCRKPVRKRTRRIPAQV